MTLQIHGEIHQLKTRKGTYINILRSMTDGGVAVWGNSYKHPTYLLIRGENWLLVTFDDEAWRDQELPNLMRSWAPDKVFVLPDMDALEEKWTTK